MSTKKLLALFAALSLSVCSLTACGSNDSSSESASPASSAAESAPESSEPESSEPEKEPETDEEWHQAMLKKSLFSLGDTSRLMQKIEKAKSGEKVTVAYLGGSITEGISAGPDLCYARLSYEKFAERFGTGDNVEYVNAGLSGTPSILGNMRLERDILSHDPDICFVEFAVNDGTNEDYQAAYESIVRELLEKDVAVILLFSVTADDYSAQDYMKQIGEYYGLPMISYCDALRYMFENNRMTWKDFSDDKSHPNKEGHAMVAEMVDHFFETAAASEPARKDYPASPMSILVQQGMTMLENTNTEPESTGSWTKGSSINTFTNGWTFDPDSDNEPLKFKFTGKFAYLIYKEVSQSNSSFGDLHVKVTCDGELYEEKDIQTATKDGWGNPQTVMLGMQAADKEYEVEISMAEGSEDLLGEVLAIAHN